MAVQLSANYSKKLGLPGFSSHSFSVSLQVELTDLSQVEAECQKLYTLLQQSVDHEIQAVGFIPKPTYGTNGNGHPPNRNGSTHARGNGSHGPSTVGDRHADHWNCTEGQRGFILRIINENNLDKQGTDDLAQQLFGAGVKHLNKMQASQLIEELLAKAGRPRQSRWQPTQTSVPTISS